MMGRNDVGFVCLVCAIVRTLICSSLWKRFMRLVMWMRLLCSKWFDSRLVLWNVCVCIVFVWLCSLSVRYGMLECVCSWFLREYAKILLIWLLVCSVVIVGVDLDMLFNMGYLVDVVW